MPTYRRTRGSSWRGTFSVRTVLYKDRNGVLDKLGLEGNLTTR